MKQAKRLCNLTCAILSVCGILILSCMGTENAWGATYPTINTLVYSSAAMPTPTTTTTLQVTTTIQPTTTTTQPVTIKYVDDSSVCTESSSTFCTVQEAVESINPATDNNSTIIVRYGNDGIYDGFIVNKSQLTIRAAEGATPVIKGLQAVIEPGINDIYTSIVIGASNVTLKGFDIQGGTGQDDPKDCGIFILGNGQALSFNGNLYKAKAETVKNINIINNKISGFKPKDASGNKSDRGYGIFIYGTFYINDTPYGAASNITIGGSIDNSNIITGNHRGIGVLGNVPDLLINYNNLADNDRTYNNLTGELISDSIDNGGHALGFYYPPVAGSEINAKQNWWGASDGPWGKGLIDFCLPCKQAAGSGDEIFMYNPVCFYPFATQADLKAFSPTSDCLVTKTTTTITSTTTTTTTTPTTTIPGGGGGSGGEGATVPVLSTTGYVKIQSAEESGTITIINSGGGDLNWTIDNTTYSNGNGWIKSIAPAAGTNTGVVTITVDRGILSQGIYNAKIAIKSNGGNDVINVAMGVGNVYVPAPALFVNPSSLDFGIASTEKTITVGNEGDAEGTWDVHILYDKKGAGWLSFASNTVTLKAQDNATLTVNVDRSSLSPDNYSATIEFLSQPTGDPAPVSINVILSVPEEGSPTLSVNKDFIFVKRNETSAEIKIKNSGTGTLNWNVGDITYGKRGKDWLNTEPSDGSIAADQESAMTLNVNRSGLPFGFYKAVLPIKSNGGDKNITVIMWRPLFGN